MSAYLTPEEAHERLARGEALEAGIGRLYRAHGNSIEFCDPHGWEESRRHGGSRELVETVQLRVPTPALADDLRALFQNNQYAFAVCESGLAEWIDEQLRQILHKHGEAE